MKKIIEKICLIIILSLFISCQNEIESQEEVTIKYLLETDCFKYRIDSTKLSNEVLDYITLSYRETLNQETVILGEFESIRSGIINTIPLDSMVFSMYITANISDDSREWDIEEKYVELKTLSEN